MSLKCSWRHFVSPHARPSGRTSNKPGLNHNTLSHLKAHPFLCDWPPPLISIQVRLCSEEAGKKNVCRLGHRSEMIFVCFNLAVFLKQQLLSRQINGLVFFFCSVCDGGLHEDLVFQSVQWKPDVAWDGWSVSPAVSMRCVLLILLLNLVATSPVPPPTRQANGCHGCTRICMGMWGVSIVRTCVEIKVVVPYLTRLPGSYAEAWEYVLAGGMSVFKCIINKKIPTCSGTVGASGITVNCPHDMPSFCPADRFLLLLFFDLQQQSSQENKDVVSTMNLSFASSALWKMSHWFAQSISDNWI